MELTEKEKDIVSNIQSIPLSRLKKWAKDNMEYIGQGRDRIVYGYGQIAVKIAKNKEGKTQNSAHDQMISTYDLCPIMLMREENDNYIIVERLQKLEKGDFENLTGSKWGMFCDAIENYCNQYTPDSRLFNDKHWSNYQEQYEWADNIPFVFEVYDLLGCYTPKMWQDLLRRSSWRKTTDGKQVKLADLGTFSQIKK